MSEYNKALSVTKSYEEEVKEMEGILDAYYKNILVALSVTKSYEEEVKEMEGILDAYYKNILVLIERTRKADVCRKRRKM